MGDGATLGVDRIFSHCPTVGNWSEKPVTLWFCLVFITNGREVNLAARTMVNVPKKHVGIFSEGWIYNYSKSSRGVVKQTPDVFKNHYGKPHNDMFYGYMPFVPLFPRKFVALPRFPGLARSPGVDAWKCTLR